VLQVRVAARDAHPHQLGPRREAELREDFAQVVLDRPRAEIELRRDLTVVGTDKVQFDQPVDRRAVKQAQDFRDIRIGYENERLVASLSNNRISSIRVH